MTAIKGCGCSDNLNNTGVPKGNKIFGTAVALLMQETYDNTGALNTIDLTSAIKAQILADLNEKDPAKRLFPIIDIDGIEPAQEGAQFETRPNGVRIKTREGINSLTIHFATEASHQLFRQVANVCKHVSIYLIDECGNLQGVKVGNSLRGRRINFKSYNAEIEPKTFTEAQKIAINFDWYSRNELLNLWMLTADEIGGDLTTVKGQIDVLVNPSAASATDLTITPTFNYGTALALVPVLGLTTGEIEVFNVTTGLAVTVATVTFVPATNSYTVAYASGVTANDVLRVTVYKAVTEFDVNPLFGTEEITAA